MKLSDYLEQHEISISAFAETIGTTHASVSRYASGDRCPNREAMRRIIEATGGKVQPNDFYDEGEAA